MDYDVISNLTLNFTVDGDVSPEESMSMIFHEIVLSIICLAGIIADGLIIYVIARYKNMKSPTNTYIMNWLIGDAVYLMLTPCFYRIFSALEDLFIWEELVCISFELASVLQITSIAFIIVLCLNWYLTVFTVRFGQFYVYVVALVWLLALGGMLAFTGLCVNHSYTLVSHNVLFFGYAGLMCLMIGMHVTKYFTRGQDVHGKLALNLALATCYVLCWFPSWTCLLVSSLDLRDNYLELYYASIVAACMGYLNSLLNLYVLARCNRNFRMCLLQVFRCVHRDYDNQSFQGSDEYLHNIHRLSDSSFVTLDWVYHERSA